jgi:AsmA protein
VQFALAADQIDTAELQQIAAAPSKPVPATAAAPAKPAGPGVFLSTTGSGTLAVGTLKAEDLVLKNVNAKCTLNRGVVQLSPLTADTFGGKANGTLTADMRPAVPQCAAQIKLAGVDANALLSSVSSVKNTVYGSLAADSNLHFALASSAALTKTLNGTLGFNLTNGQIKNVNILGAISQVSKVLGTPTSSVANGMAVKTFSGTLNIVNGVANTNNLTAALDSGSLTGKGTLNLVDQGVNMNTVATVAGLGAVPVLVTGTMASPRVVPDVAALAKANAAGAINKALGNKGGSVGGILGGVLNGLGKKK